MAFVPGRKHDIFVSYAHEDEAWVRDFIADLNEEINSNRVLLERVDIFWDELRDGIAPHRSDLRSHVDESAIFLAVMSPTFLSKDYCDAERSWFQSPRLNPPIQKVVLRKDRNEVYKKWGVENTEQLFCDNAGPFARSSDSYKKAIAELSNKLDRSLDERYGRARMIFLHDGRTGNSHKEFHRLADLLVADGFRVGPIGQTSNVSRALEGELLQSRLAIFFLSEPPQKSLRDLIDYSVANQKPTVLWFLTTGPEDVIKNKPNLATWWKTLEDSVHVVIAPDAKEAFEDLKSASKKLGLEWLDKKMVCYLRAKGADADARGFNEIFEKAVARHVNEKQSLDPKFVSSSGEIKVNRKNRKVWVIVYWTHDEDTGWVVKVAGNVSKDQKAHGLSFVVYNEDDPQRRAFPVEITQEHRLGNSGAAEDVPFIPCNFKAFLESMGFTTTNL